MGTASWAAVLAAAAAAVVAGLTAGSPSAVVELLQSLEMAATVVLVALVV